MRKQKLTIGLIQGIVALLLLFGAFTGAYAVQKKEVRDLKESTQKDSERVRELEKKQASLESKLDTAIDLLKDIKKEVKK